MAQMLYACLLLLLLEPAALAQCPPGTIGDVCQQSICSGCGDGNLFPDLEDCHRFYACTGDGTYLPDSLPCSNGQVFSYSSQGCQEPSADVSCPPCPQTQKECVYECPEEGRLRVANPTECYIYYECSDGFATLQQCDEGTFFNGTECQADQTLCCRCQPSCDKLGTYYVIDPIDCRKYWACIGITTTTTTKSSGRGRAGPSLNTSKPISAAKPSLHLDTSAPPALPLLFRGTPKSRPQYSDTCEEGEVFDTGAGQCLEGALCITQCPNVVDATGCIDPFICFTTGTFPKCTNQCIQEYYNCKEVTYPEYKDPDLCYTGLVFHPDDHICVNPDECPY